MNLVSLLDLQTVNSLKEQGWPLNSIGREIEPYTVDEMIREDAPKIVLVSPRIDENDFFIYGIREQFYALFSPTKSIRIADAGTFTGRPDQLAEALKKIREYGSIPVLISSHQNLTFDLYQSYILQEQTVNLLSVDPKPDLGLVDFEESNNGWLHPILSYSPNYLFNYSLIGVQSYLSDPEMLKTLQDMNFDVHRLGQVRQNIILTEPYFRNTDFVSFDVSSIRFADFQSAMEAEPNGLYAEEACRLLRYAGLSNKMTSIGIFGWSISKRNDSDISEKLVAQLIWHLLDGVANRINDGTIGNNADYTTYTLSSDTTSEELVFYKNIRNGRWWMKVPLRNTSGGRYQRHQVVPCNYEDYIQAMNGEIPDTWWQTYQKLT